MTLDELKHRLGDILSKEECGPDIDWDLVSCLSAQLAQELDGDTPTLVFGYLGGADQRRADSDFARAQRSELVSFLRGGAAAA